MRTIFAPSAAAASASLLLTLPTVGICAADQPAATKSAPVTPAASAPSLDELRAIAEEAYIYGLPIVMNYGVMYDFVIDRSSGQWKGDFNTISNEHRVFTWQDTSIPTPNSDTPYSMCWLDLRAEPIVISVPAVERSRYYSVMLCDGNCFNYGYIGSRATGSDAGDYLIAGPAWKGETPKGIKKVFRSTTDFGLTVFRTQLFNAADMPNVERVQAGYKARPLSAYLGTPAPAPAPEVKWPKIDKQLAKTGFFEYLGFALQFAPAGPEEAAIRAKLAKLGIGPGAARPHAALTPEEKKAVIEGVMAGEKKVTAAAGSIGKSINGWRVGSGFGDRAFYNGDWLLRAAAAQAGIYGNNADEAMYPMTRWLADGEVIDAGKHNYTITFPKGQFPPVNAFWSVTMYDGATQLLIKNPIDRYLINSPMLPSMKTNADGSLTMYIQKDSPGKDLESNWLPAPNGPVYLVMRLYWPKPPAEGPSILPPGSGSWSPPAIVKVK